MLYPYQALKFMFTIIHKNTTLKALNVALNMFKIDNKVLKIRSVSLTLITPIKTYIPAKNANDVVLVFLLLTLNTFYSFF